MESSPSPLIITIDHPSLDRAAHQFADVLRQEQRFFGPTSDPKPNPALINRLVSTGAPRLGAVVDGTVVGMCRVQHDGLTTIVVVRPWRRRGIGRILLTAATQRSAAAGLDTMVVQTSRRGRGIAALGRSIGAAVVDQGCGRIDLIVDTQSLSRTA